MFLEEAALPLLDPTAQSQIGFIRKHDVLAALKQSTLAHDFLNISDNAVTLSNAYGSWKERSECMRRLLEDWRMRNVFACLTRGWRNEQYPVYDLDGKNILFTMERAACGLFGVRQFGCHLNGYFRDKDAKMMMWVARRSATKQVYPGQLDNMVRYALMASSSICYFVGGRWTAIWTAAQGKYGQRST